MKRLSGLVASVLGRLLSFPLLLSMLLAGCATPGGPTGSSPMSATSAYPPIVFVHGNGDNAAIWMPMIWRFESNGWPRERLHAFEMPFPLARDDDTLAQPGRSSTTEQMQRLATEVDQVLARTGASKVVLVALSRGGYAVRNYVRNGGGASRVSHAVLGGTPNHGVWATDVRPNNEFNGRGPFLTALNAPQGPGGEEVTPGVKWLTLRSDNNDKFAQPEGRWIGQPGVPTNVTSEGPALKGAVNIVLPGVDHRETILHPKAFEQTWLFLTGKAPATLAITPERQVVLNGRVVAFEGPAVTNVPLAGAMLEVFEVSAASGERLGASVHRKVVGADGGWGPFQARADAYYEFVVTAPGYAITHLYREPFPRSSGIVTIRPVRLSDADRRAASLVILDRPRGYFDVARDKMALDGRTPPGIPPGSAGVSSSKLALPEASPRTVVAEFNGQRIAVRTWPVSANHVVIAELH